MSQSTPRVQAHNDAIAAGRAKHVDGELVMLARGLERLITAVLGLCPCCSDAGGVCADCSFLVLEVRVVRRKLYGLTLDAARNVARHCIERESPTWVAEIERRAEASAKLADECIEDAHEVAQRKAEYAELQKLKADLAAAQTELNKRRNR